MGAILSTYVATKILVSEPSFQQLMDVISKEIKGTSAVLMKEIELQHLRVQETNTLIFNTVVIVIGGLVICKGMNHLYDYYTLRKTKYV
jgi:hypothetical protein